MKQKWDCSQIEDSFEEGDVTDWYEDDEMMRHWEEVSKEEEKIGTRQTAGNGLQIQGVQRVPQLVVSHILTKEKGLKKKERKGKVVGWSTEKMEEKANNQLDKDTGKS